MEKYRRTFEEVQDVFHNVKFCEVGINVSRGLDYAAASLNA